MFKLQNHCDCIDCAKAQEVVTTFAEVHSFVFQNPANFNGEMEDLECDLHFDSVCYLDDELADETRYFIYRLEDGALVAWFDSAREIGYKSMLCANFLN